MQNEIEFFRKEYQKQKKLELIVSSRVLIRPNVKKWQVSASIVILPFLIFLGILFICQLNLSLGFKVVLCATVVLIIFESYLRFCLVLVVKRYQAVAKEETRKRCKCIPSCSEYAVICLKSVFPLVIALLKIRKRLFVTCKGEEYIIDFPNKKMGEEFESKL